MACRVPFTSVSLLLTGIRWHIHARDAEASLVVAAFGEAMSLSPVGSPSNQSTGEQCRELQVLVDPGLSGFSSGGYESGPVYCLLPPPKNNDMLVLGMSFIALAISRAELSRGGLLFHGALAQSPDPLKAGIILTGPGTVGKTTASNRLPLPWRSLSDDASLVVRDDRGQYMVHPWPTWSRFYCGPDGNPGPGGRWNVQSGVSLQAIFFLAQSKEDRIAPLPPTPSVAYLMETIQHVSSLMPRYLPADEAQTLYKNQMTAAEELIRNTPAYTLHLSITGTFWKNIEETLASAPITSSMHYDHATDTLTDPEQKNDSSQQILSDNTTLTVSYSGSSMDPTLRHPDLLEVLPYTGKLIRPGDVVYFHSPLNGLKVVHRVVRITSDGIRTCGDSNSLQDPYLLQSADIIGQVTTAWHHNKRREITGGLWGTWNGYRAGIYGRLNKKISPMLHGIYHGLAANGFLRYLIPDSFQPRVFQFKQRYLPPILKLIVNGHVIGHYDVWKKLWVINRPWRLIIDEAKLPIVAESPYSEPSDQDNAPMENTPVQNQQI